MEAGATRGEFASGKIYGVGLLVQSDTAENLRVAIGRLGPVWTAAEPEPGALRLQLAPADDERYALSVDDELVVVGGSEVVLDTFERVVRRHVAFHAPDHVFIHAGAVEHGGRALIVPGRSHSGKSTLVNALVQAGATYFSDEYAVLDGEGIVHPFPKPIALREEPGSAEQTNYRVEELGGSIGRHPAPLGLVVLTRYRAGAEWQPSQLSGAELVVEMFGHTYLAPDRPEQSMRVLHAAIGTATGLKGDRGEAQEIVADLMTVASELGAGH